MRQGPGDGTDLGYPQLLAGKRRAIGMVKNSWSSLSGWCTPTARAQQLRPCSHLTLGMILLNPEVIDPF